MTNLELPDLATMHKEGFMRGYTVKPDSEEFKRVIDEALPWIKWFICPYFSESRQQTLLEMWFKEE